MTTTPITDVFGYSRESNLEVREFAPAEPTLLGEFMDAERAALSGDRPPLGYALYMHLRFMGVQLVDKVTGNIVRDAYGNEPASNLT